MQRLMLVSAVGALAVCFALPVHAQSAAARLEPTKGNATAGNVTFTEQENNTLVHVIMQWASPPGGALGDAIAKLFQNPESMLEEDLQRFKDIAEGRVGSGIRR